MTWLCVIDYFSSQSAALQKKLHHLEVQLNNEKQIKDDLEHKYRYSSCCINKILTYSGTNFHLFKISCSLFSELPLVVWTNSPKN